MSDTPFIGQIKLFSFNFPPRSHAFCNGQLLSIAQNTALFSLLGTTYGGNGVNTFGLPNLQGRLPLHWGQGPGLSNYVIGEVAGTENVTLLINQIPQHNHLAVASSNTADQTYPNGNLWASGANEQGYNSTANGVLSPASVAITGNSQPHNNMAPYTVINYSIALVGIFPSRN